MATIDSALQDHAAAIPGRRKPSRVTVPNQHIGSVPDTSQQLLRNRQHILSSEFLSPILDYFAKPASYSSSVSPFYSSLASDVCGNFGGSIPPYGYEPFGFGYDQFAIPECLAHAMDTSQTYYEQYDRPNETLSTGSVSQTTVHTQNNITSTFDPPACLSNLTDFLDPTFVSNDDTGCWMSGVWNSIDIDGPDQHIPSERLRSSGENEFSSSFAPGQSSSNDICESDPGNKCADLVSEAMWQEILSYDNMFNGVQGLTDGWITEKPDILSSHCAVPQQSIESGASQSIANNATVSSVGLAAQDWADNSVTAGTIPSAALFKNGHDDHPQQHRKITILSTTVARSRSSQWGGSVKRAKGRRCQPLTKQQRKTAAEMRKVKACWCCAIQRDKCDGKEPCERCRQKWLRATCTPSTVLPCDRRPLSQLLDLVIPPSLCRSTKRSEALNFVSVRIRCWMSASLVVPLSFGYGPVIDWVVMREFKLHAEFDSFRYQILYDTSEVDGSLHIIRKRSPCLALTHINEDDHAKFHKFIDNVIEQDLEKFAVDCFDREHQFQKDAFRMLCDLYCRLGAQSDADERLVAALHSVLRMLVVTRIICTPLQIPDESMPSVISQLQFDNSPEEYAANTSSRIASFQIKYYFSHIRSETYASILKILHVIYRTGEQKEKTWLIALCCTLGLSMVLEECQHLIYMQWDSRIEKDNVDPVIARQMTLSDCGLIDEQFSFLVQLFNVKYSRKNVCFPSYLDYLPGCKVGGPEYEFIVGLRGLMQDNVGYLKARASLELSHENERQWTSRLLARFLGHFMELDLESQV